MAAAEAGAGRGEDDAAAALAFAKLISWKNWGAAELFVAGRSLSRRTNRRS